MILDETSERVEAAVDMDDKLTEILDLIYDEVTEVSYAEHADVMVVKVTWGTDTRWT